ncbi:putative membrane protein YdjX (TVP38/TMEM64 family) [Peptoniphilus ivorii]|uniref:TVP38/TMEM64 family protein n=1 Tax=Aedoeadaptatus ivorii TaxID=54006 RepID=UPI002781B64F|nr:TVP38/TMEM64 family protein [Peptoniphilus ivorii]MDQ0508115.1 putative membrane protein YdjX (TVP38/TMEM64 family) [Peptoniphilus ivorii]
MKKPSKKLITVGVILACLLAYLLIPSVNAGINRAVKVLTTEGIEGIAAYIRSFGVYAVIVSFLLMILQSLISPIPAFFITLANSAIFGWVNGAILSWTSSMAGAAMCFYISRILGRDVAERFTGSGMLETVDKFFEDYGKFAILIARLLPFMSFDLVSYAAGLTSMSFVHFFIATGLGQLPATIVYSYVGGSLTGGAQKLMTGLLILFAASIAIYVIKRIYNEKHGKQDA